MDASMCRYLKAPAGSVSELYERYPSGAERGAFALVLGDNMFYAYHVDGEYRGQWRPVGGDSSPGGNTPGGDTPGGNDPGGNGNTDPGGNDPGGNDPGGDNPGGDDPADPTAQDIIFTGIVTDGTNPVSGVLVKVPTSAVAQIGEAITDAEGRYRVVWENVTESDYADILLSFKISTSKEGYVDSLFSIQKPTFSSAIADGITINAVIEASEVIGPSEFSVSPGSITFPWNTTSVGVDVVCSDTTWEVVSSPDFVTPQVFKGTGDRQNFILLGTSSNNTSGEDRTGQVVVGWQGQTATINVTQIAQAVSEGTVTFRGQVIDSSTNSPVAGATVTVTTSGTIAAAGHTGTTRTDSNGKFSYAWQVDEATWLKATDADVAVEKAGYEGSSVNVDLYTSYTGAVLDGFSAGTVSITPAASPFSISTRNIDFRRAGGTHDIIVTCPDNTWIAGRELHYADSSYYELLPHNNDIFHIYRLNDNTVRVIGKGNTTSSNWGTYVEFKWGDTILSCIISHYNS